MGILKADTLSINPQIVQIEELWVVCVMVVVSYAIGGNIVM